VIFPYTLRQKRVLLLGAAVTVPLAFAAVPTDTSRMFPHPAFRERTQHSYPSTLKLLGPVGIFLMEGLGNPCLNFVA